MKLKIWHCAGWRGDEHSFEGSGYCDVLAETATKACDLAYEWARSNNLLRMSFEENNVKEITAEQLDGEIERHLANAFAKMSHEIVIRYRVYT